MQILRLEDDRLSFVRGGPGSAHIGWESQRQQQRAACGATTPTQLDGRTMPLVEVCIACHQLLARNYTSVYNVQHYVKLSWPDRVWEGEHFVANGNAYGRFEGREEELITIRRLGDVMEIVGGSIGEVRGRVRRTDMGLLEIDMETH